MMIVPCFQNECVTLYQGDCRVAPSPCSATAGICAETLSGKPNPTPERVKDRPHRSHEYLFLLSKSARYSFVLPKDRRTSVWTVPTKPYKGHRAVFPPKLIEPCILAGSRPGDLVLDPFAGSGTTLATAAQTGRKAVGVELNPDYCTLIAERLRHAHSSNDKRR